MVQIQLNIYVNIGNHKINVTQILKAHKHKSVTIKRYEPEQLEDPSIFVWQHIKVVKSSGKRQCEHTFIYSGNRYTVKDTLQFKCFMQVKTITKMKCSDG